MDKHILLESRKLKIDLITDTPNPIIDLFNEVWSKLYIIETNVYHEYGGEFIYFVVDIEDNTKEWIFFQDNANEIFWCNYIRYWSLFESKFSLDFRVIQSHTRLLVENAINSVILTPSPKFLNAQNGVTNALNGVITPIGIGYISNIIVENALRGVVATPNKRFHQDSYIIDDVLNIHIDLN